MVKVVNFVFCILTKSRKSSTGTHYNMESLENIMLCGRSQSQNNTYCMIPFMLNSQNRHNRDTESKLVVPNPGRGSSGREWAVTASRYGVSFSAWWNALKWILVMFSRLKQKNIWIVHIKWMNFVACKYPWSCYTKIFLTKGTKKMSTYRSLKMIFPPRK